MVSTPPVRIPAQDRRRQILEVALELFARQGFEGTTTRQIAARAGVNEALIFRHFPSKEELYWAVIEQKCRAAGGRERFSRILRGSTDDRETFVQIAHDILRRNIRDTGMSRLLLFSALEQHELSHRFFRTFVADFYDELAEHIAARVRAGKFRNVDPLLAARGFLGMVVYHFLVQELFGAKRTKNFDTRAVAEHLADIWLEGVLPRNGHNGPNSRAKRNSKQ